NGHLAGLREDAPWLEQPRDVLHAERRRLGTQLLRRWPEIPRPAPAMAVAESEMARRQRLRAVRPHALACDAEQVLRRRRAGADRAQPHGDRLRGGGISRADVRASLRHLAEEPGARLARLVDGSENRKDAHV